MLDGLHLHLQRLRLFHRQDFSTVTQVVVRHGKVSPLVSHLADDTGHILISGQLTGPHAARTRRRSHSRRPHGDGPAQAIDARRLDGVHQPRAFLRRHGRRKGWSRTGAAPVGSRYTISSFSRRSELLPRGGAMVASTSLCCCTLAPAWPYFGLLISVPA